MYKRKSIKKLGRKTSHRKALIRNQLRSVLKSGKIKTSSIRAKVLRGELESILNRIKITKEGDLSLTRDLNDIFGSKELIKKVREIGKQDSTKVSIKKIGFRKGDNMEVSLLEIMGLEKKTKSKEKTIEKEKKVEEEVVSDTEKEVEKNKGILSLGRKRISQKVEPIKRERARSRSGL